LSKCTIGQGTSSILPHHGKKRAVELYLKRTDRSGIIEVKIKAIVAIVTKINQSFFFFLESLIF